MLKLRYWFIAILLVMFTVPVAWAISEDNATIQKAFILYDGSKGDPYTMFYPFELKRPGEITLLVRTWDLDPDPKNQNFEPLNLVLVDSRAFKQMKPEDWKQWLQKANKYNPAEWLAGDEIRAFVKGIKNLLGKKEKPPKYYHGGIAMGREGTSESLKHAVDMPELSVTAGQYVAILRNKAPFKAEGAIMISYPGDEWELDPAVEEKTQVKPDLVVKNILLNREGKVVVQVTNQGKGALNLAKWHAKGPDAVTLMIRVNGKDWGGVTLPALDPEKALHKPGGVVTYVSNLELKVPAQVMASIDASDKVMEEAERNNRKAVELDPKDAGKRHKRSTDAEAMNN